MQLLIPTIVLLYGIDIKVAGSLSLAVSLPTMLVAFARYSRDQSFAVLVENKTFLLAISRIRHRNGPRWVFLIPLREWSEASLPSWDRPKSSGAQPTRSHLA